MELHADRPGDMREAVGGGGENRSPGAQRRIGRHRLRYHGLWHTSTLLMDERCRPLPERWELLYRTPYSEMVGARLRRLRL